MVVCQRVRLHPENVTHRLDSSYDNSFAIDASCLPSCIERVEPERGSIDLADEGALGSFNFRLFLRPAPKELPATSLSSPEAIKITVRLLILPYTDLRGTPCMLSNSIQIPIEFSPATTTSESDTATTTTTSDQQKASLPDIEPDLPLQLRKNCVSCASYQHELQ